MIDDRVVNLQGTPTKTPHLQRQVDVLMIAEEPLIKSASRFKRVPPIGRCRSTGTKNRKIFRVSS